MQLTVVRDGKFTHKSVDPWLAVLWIVSRVCVCMCVYSCVYSWWLRSLLEKSLYALFACLHWRSSLFISYSQSRTVPRRASYVSISACWQWSTLTLSLLRTSEVSKDLHSEYVVNFSDFVAQVAYIHDSAYYRGSCERGKPLQVQTGDREKRRVT